MDQSDHQATTHRVQPETDEEARLESALYGPDLLGESLREDERRRRRRRLITLTLLLGGIVMGTTLTAVLAGWLTLTAPQADDETTASTAGAPLDQGSRIERAEELAAQGWRLWQERRLTEAANQFEQALKLDPESPNIWNGLGWARFNAGETDGAIEAFEKCVEFEPDHPAGLNGLGQAYLSLREYKTAEKFLTKAAPQASAAWFGLARLYLLTGDYKKAQRWINKSLREQPQDATLTAMLAAARDGALPDDLRNEIEPPARAKESPDAQAASQGWRQFNEGKLRSAERSFRRALAKDPENGVALNGLGFSLLASGKAATAKQYFEKCLKLEPDAAGPMNGLARCLMAEGKVDEAIKVWERLRAKYPGPNAAVVGLATTYSERKEFDKAVPLFEELVKSQPENEEFRKGLEVAKTGAAAAEKSAAGGE